MNHVVNGETAEKSLPAVQAVTRESKGVTPPPPPFILQLLDGISALHFKCLHSCLEDEYSPLIGQT